MTRRYRERIEVTAGRADSIPTGFRWRGRTYHVLTVLGHWREDAGYWAGGGVEIPQRDLWRVEAADSAGAGVYELVREARSWLLDRVWD